MMVHIINKLTFDLESGVRVTCDVGYLCANLVFLGLSVLELRLMYATDRRQTKASLNKNKNDNNYYCCYRYCQDLNNNDSSCN